MAKPIEIIVFSIKHKGFFEYDKLHGAIKSFFSNKQFHAFDMPKFKQKPPHARGLDHEIKYEGSKRLTEYVKVGIKVRLLIVNMQDVELVKEGTKMVMQEGQVVAEVSADLHLDYQGRFGGNAFLQWLEEVFHKIVLKRQIKDYWMKVVYGLAFELTKDIQKALGQEVM